MANRVARVDRHVSSAVRVPRRREAGAPAAEPDRLRQRGVRGRTASLPLAPLPFLLRGSLRRAGGGGDMHHARLPQVPSNGGMAGSKHQWSLGQSRPRSVSSQRMGLLGSAQQLTRAACRSTSCSVSPPDVERDPCPSVCEATDSLVHEGKPIGHTAGILDDEATPH